MQIYHCCYKKDVKTNYNLTISIFGSTFLNVMFFVSEVKAVVSEANVLVTDLSPKEHIIIIFLLTFEIQMQNLLF